MKPSSTMSSWLANANRHRSHFPHNFWNSYEYLLMGTMKILMLIKWSYRSSPSIMLIIEPRMDLKFLSTSSNLFLNTCLFGICSWSWYLFLESALATYHSNTGVQYRGGAESSTSILILREFDAPVQCVKVADMNCFICRDG